MAKTVLPKAGGGILMKLIGTAAVLALVVVVVKHPSDAAAWVQGVVDIAVGAVDGIAAFFRQLAG